MGRVVARAVVWNVALPPHPAARQGAPSGCSRVPAPGVWMRSQHGCMPAACLQGQSKPKKQPPTAEERRMQRGNIAWLGAAGAAVGAYVVLSGHYIQVVEMDEEPEMYVEEDVEEDEEDDDEEDLE